MIGRLQTSRREIRVGVLVLIVAVWVFIPRTAQADDLQDQLAWGPHAVGFRSQIVLDHARRYETTFDEGQTYGAGGKSPRPILINIWYPAKAADSGEPAATRMEYGDYLRLQSDQPDVQRWADALSTYAEGVIAQEFFATSVDELNADQLLAWHRFLASPTRCQRDAAPQAGPFPVVVYHSGAGSSFEDNSVFCEYLASCGYVIIGSAFQAADGSSFGIDARDGSVADMEFLARHAASLSFVDWRRMAFAGHSAGAQASLRALTRTDCPADVLVMLDTTVDYYSLAVPTFRYITDLAIEHIEQLRRPMLVCAGPEAAFQMCDRLVNSDRVYLTVPELGHNEFIAQGVLRLGVLKWMGEDALSEELQKELKRAEKVERLYVQTCQATQAWLDLQLQQQLDAFEQLAKDYSKTQLGEDQLAVEFVPVGVSQADAYQEDSHVAPTPRQLYRLASEVSIDRITRILEQHREQSAESPVYQSNMLMCSLLYDLLEQDRLEDARRLNAYAQAIGVDGVSTLRFLAFMSKLGSHNERARHFLERALLVDPNDEESKQLLKELEGGN